MTYELWTGDCLEVLATLPAHSVHCVVTSPPYLGLRDYGTAQWLGGDPTCPHTPGGTRRVGRTTLGGGTATTGHQQEAYRQTCGKCGATRIDRQIGLEATPDAYVAKLVAVFREVWRVLRDDGVVWLNLGDSYANRDKGALSCCKEKDLMGIPWRVAFALQAEGWYLRSDCIWHKCLSGGTWLYVKSQKGVMPMMIKDMVRLSNVQLWDGEKWVKVVSWSKNERTGEEIELVLRSGERISCTPEHRFPTANGLKEAKDLTIGDKLQSTVFPDQGKTPAYLTDDALWFVGLYIAEGSRSQDCIQIAGHIKEEERWERIQRLCAHYGARCTRSITGNKMDIRVYGKVINAIIDQHVSGSNAKDKGLTTACWQYDNAALNFILHGYLSGDGHFDSQNNRYRLGFARNYNLERDLRLICARLGYSITLNMSTVAYNGGQSPTFRGEIRMDKSDHWNAKDRNEIVEIRNARCRYTYDIAVDSEPHLFALASGILTHNSNPMPESVCDRPTRAHEYIFLLTKRERYFYDSEAIKEPAVHAGQRIRLGPKSFSKGQATGAGVQANGNGLTDTYEVPLTRNKRSVWTVTPKAYKGAHFAVFPPDLIEPCILAGTSAHGACSACGAPYGRVLEVVGRQQARWAKGAAVVEAQYGAVGKTSVLATAEVAVKATVGWRPTCTCNQEGIAYAPDDLEVIETPTGSGDGDDPTLLTGRKGLNRPRNADEGKRTMTRYEQRQYAAQLRTSPHRAAMAAEAGNAFAHYLRTDRSGARPVPASLLDAWLARGWVQAVPVPSFTPYPVVPCRVLDPFSGSGTTGAVALKHGRDYWGIDLNPAYTMLAQERIRKAIG